ncbi:hypothetical protein [Acidihalobacter ferrooxydans]|uniref:Uncharacterized protein n=1 Tax=Acidihalobacter ferrooxydans TaxID=1765967 RepID=A0A1P8UIZ2_9GAMM|nr:hypothetical protein [Acidihalobacter ferrooxydans]APZ43787.1 hypothetical protein BW247_12405 [Acidihalobacter ferrooxydans]
MNTDKTYKIIAAASAGLITAAGVFTKQVGIWESPIIMTLIYVLIEGLGMIDLFDEDDDKSKSTSTSKEDKKP